MSAHSPASKSGISVIGASIAVPPIDLNKEWVTRCTGNNNSLFCEAGRSKGAVLLLNKVALERSLPHDIQKVLSDGLLSIEESPYLPLIQVVLYNFFNFDEGRSTEKLFKTWLNKTPIRVRGDGENRIVYGSQKQWVAGLDAIKLLPGGTSSLYTLLKINSAFEMQLSLSATVIKKVGDVLLDLGTNLIPLLKIIHGFVNCDGTTTESVMESIRNDIDAFHFPNWNNLAHLLSAFDSIQRVLKMLANTHSDKVMVAITDVLQKKQQGVFAGIKTFLVKTAVDTSLVRKSLEEVRLHAMRSEQTMSEVFQKLGVTVLGPGVVQIAPSVRRLNPYAFKDAAAARIAFYPKMEWMQFKWSFTDVHGGEWHVMPPEEWRHNNASNPLSGKYWAARLLDVLGMDLTRYAGREHSPLDDLERIEVAGVTSVNWTVYVEKACAMVETAKKGIHSRRQSLKHIYNKYRSDHIMWIRKYTELVANSQIAFAVAAAEAILELSKRLTAGTGGGAGLSKDLSEKLKRVVLTQLVEQGRSP